MKIRRLRNHKGRFSKSVARARLCFFFLIVLALLVIYGGCEKAEYKPLSPVQDINAYYRDIVPTPTPIPDQTIESFIKDVFGKNGRMAVAIAKGECQGLHPECLNKNEKEWSCGLFQINIKAHFRKIPGNTFEEKEKWLFDWRNNVVMAKTIFEESGWYPWAAFTSKSYLEYL